MRKETLKEVGKFFLDLGKISAGLGLLLPVFKGEQLELINTILALFSAVVFLILGVALINRGAQE